MSGCCGVVVGVVVDGVAGFVVVVVAVGVGVVVVVVGVCFVVVGGGCLVVVVVCLLIRVETVGNIGLLPVLQVPLPRWLRALLVALQLPMLR